MTFDLGAIATLALGIAGALIAAVKFRIDLATFRTATEFHQQAVDGAIESLAETVKDLDGDRMRALTDRIAKLEP